MSRLDYHVAKVQGKMLLTDPVSKYIPAFEKTTVMGLTETAFSPFRPITIRHLMTHTSGASYGGGRLEEVYKAAGFTQWYFADRQEPRRRGPPDLMSQPGVATKSSSRSLALSGSLRYP